MRIFSSALVLVCAFISTIDAQTTTTAPTTTRAATTAAPTTTTPFVIPTIPPAFNFIVNIYLPDSSTVLPKEPYMAGYVIGNSNVNSLLGSFNKPSVF